LFSDPAWDVLLEVYDSELSQISPIMAQIGVKSHTPTTTTNRWIKVLELEGLLSRRIDTLDARRVFVELTVKGRRGISGYFRAGSG
jgi:DNA-binding MarR family transcriptional regulator